jgi:hypothetical protein
VAALFIVFALRRMAENGRSHACTSLPEVRGINLDSQTRCEHNHGPTDIVAIKMHCCGVCNPQCLDQLNEIAANQDDIGALLRNVRSRLHGDSNIGIYKGRSVVNAVADHRNLAILSAKLADPFGLLVWQKLSHRSSTTRSRPTNVVTLGSFSTNCRNCCASVSISFSLLKTSRP